MPSLSQRTILAAFFGVAVSAFGAGCTTDASNDAPIIDYVDTPLHVSAANGAYTIPMTIGFHDNDEEVVTRVRYRAPPAVDAVIEISTPTPTRQSADVTLTIPAIAMGPGERRELEITIIDGRGAESRPLAQAVTFE